MNGVYSVATEKSKLDDPFVIIDTYNVQNSQKFYS